MQKIKDALLTPTPKKVLIVGDGKGKGGGGKKDGAAPKANAACRYFAKGSCKAGVKCVFEHGPPAVGQASGAKPLKAIEDKNDNGKGNGGK